MEITDVPFAVLRFQYQLARLPLQLIEEQVVAGMSSEAPTRLFYERWLGGLDAAVGKMLADTDWARNDALEIETEPAEAPQWIQEALGVRISTGSPVKAATDYWHRRRTTCS